MFAQLVRVGGALPLVGVAVLKAAPRSLADREGARSGGGAGDGREGRVDRRCAGDGSARGALDAEYVVGVDGRDLQADLVALVRGGDRVGEGGSGEDVVPVAAVGGTLPLVGVGVADAGPRSLGAGQRVGALRSAGDGRRHRVGRRRGGDGGCGRAGGADRAVRVGGRDEHADLAVLVGDPQRVARARGPGDVRVARPAVALPLIGVGVADARPGALRGAQRLRSLWGADDARDGGVHRR